MTPAQRVLRARIAGLSSAACRDMREVGRLGYEKRLDQYRLEVDPAGELTEDERTRRAALLYRAQMARVQLESSKKRAARKFEAIEAVA